MANLPADRVAVDPPFTHVGLDVFGPFYVSEGKQTRRTTANKKAWVVIFCCLTVRAVHCELITSMDTSSFINSLKRFIALRGTCASIRSDRGSNLVGATNQLSLNPASIEKELPGINCKWLFNPPGASHFGGVYERKIGSIRRVMEKTLFLAGPRGLTRDEFTTLLCEASAIVNQTPLSSISGHPDDPLPLTPQMLITLKEKDISKDPGLYTKDDLLHYGKSRWRRVQYLKAQFFNRWRTEYLHSLQLRHKWLKKKPCATVGDYVMVLDKNLPRNEWLSGVIVEINLSRDELVRSVKVRVKAKDGSFKTISRCLYDLVLLCPAPQHGC